jgi:hypothetical protein
MGIPFFKTSTIVLFPCDTRQVPVEYTWSITLKLKLKEKKVVGITLNNALGPGHSQNNGPL